MSQQQNTPSAFRKTIKSLGKGVIHVGSKIGEHPILIGLGGFIAGVIFSRKN